MSSFDGIEPCNLPGDIQPPGDCTREQHKLLKGNVTLCCKQAGPTACFEWQDCEVTLPGNLGKNERCAAARKTVMDVCFRGGNVGHREAYSNALAAVANCEEIIAKKCKKSKSDPDPAPFYQPALDSKMVQDLARSMGITVGAALLLIMMGAIVLSPAGV